MIEAEAEVPQAISAALRDGKLGVLDYYNMKNVMSDTEMRAAIGKAAAPATDKKGPQTHPPGNCGNGRGRLPELHGQRIRPSRVD